MKIFLLVWTFLLSLQGFAQDFKQFIGNFQAVALPHSCCDTFGNPVEDKFAEAYLSQMQSDEVFYDFSHAFYGSIILKNDKIVAFTVFNNTILEEEQGYDETYYLCVFSSNGKFISALPVAVHSLRSSLDEVTKNYEDTKSQFQLQSNGSLLITQETITAQEYFNENGEKIIEPTTTKTIYQLSPEGKILEQK